MLTRYASAITSGTLMTLALLFVMQALISLQPGVKVEPRDPTFVDWIRLIPDTPVQRDEPDINVDDLIRPVHTPQRTPQSTELERISVPGEKPVLPPREPGIQLGMPVDGALVNMFRVQPVYPARAQQMGLEGHVIVQLDVDATGQVANAVVVESSHQIFEKSALRAAMAFRYKPRVVDGIALPTRGIQNLFRFNMDE
tara:strand:+ start:35767 stop:36360 length:594 start_codon:yes stop_codon:yes gene_type:complete